MVIYLQKEVNAVSPMSGETGCFFLNALLEDLTILRKSLGQGNGLNFLDTTWCQALLLSSKKLFPFFSACFLFSSRFLCKIEMTIKKNG